MHDILRRFARLRRVLLAPLAAALCTCTGDKSISDAATSASPLVADDTPLSDISDARRGGPAGFYFLTPIAATLAAYPRPFDAGRSPVVEICVWTGNACTMPLVAQFTSIPANAPGQYYRVDWQTKGLSANTIYRIRVLEGPYERGHADGKLVAPPQTAASVTAQGFVPLGNGSILPIRFRLETNQPPALTIDAPASGTAVPFGVMIALSGTSTDPEDGDLSSHIVWRSNLVSGVLGTGTTVPVSLPGGTHTITASSTDFNGATTTTSIQVAVNLMSIPSTLNVPYGGTASLPIVLSSPVPAGGVSFDVTTANTAIVGVNTASVPVGEGAVAANATLAGTFPGTAVVTVANGNYGIVTSSVSTTAALDILQSSVTFTAGSTKDITVQLESAGLPIAAPAGGLSVTLTPADPACATVPSPITIPAGLVNTVVTVSYGGSATTPCQTTIDASVADNPAITTDHVAVTVQTPLPVLSITQFGGSRVGAGLRINGTTRVTLGLPAPAGGAIVTLTSGTTGTALAAPASPSGTPATAAPTVSVAAGGTTADFAIDGVEGSAGSVTFTATATGYADATTTIIVAPLAVRFDLNPPATTTALSLNSAIRAQIGALDLSGTAMGPTQEIRPGGNAVSVTFANSDASVGQLVTTSLTAQTVSATIAVGSSSTPSTLATGGVEFDPVAGGTTTVSVGGAGLTAVPVSSQAVDVTGAALSITQFGGSRVGAGLRVSGTTRVVLGAPAPAGGVTVTLTSDTPGTALAAPVSPSGTIAVAAPTVNVGAGNTTADFVVDGVEGASGLVTFTASAAGYTDATSTITVSPIAVHFSMRPPTSTTSTSTNSAMRAEIGALDATGTSMGPVQAIRPGGSPISLSFANGNAAVAQLVTSSLTDQTVTATIAVGSSTTPTTVAAGGVEFHPMAAGSTTVTVSGPGLVQVPTFSQAVTVSGAGMTISQFGGSRVGGGLRLGGTTRVTLGAPAPVGGVTVALTSATPATALAAPASPAGTIATPAPTVAVAAGGTTADFVFDGVEGATGAVTFTATAAGYSDATATVTVTPIALNFSSVPSHTTTLSTNTAVWAQVGALDVAGTGLATPQSIRPGGTPIVVTFTNSASTVAQLVTTSLAAQTVTATIAVGASATPTTVAAGGVAFDPLGSGTTTLAISGPGLTPVTTSSQLVTVDAPALSITQFGGSRVGSGLRQAGITRVTLGAPSPAGGIIVTLTSSQSAVAIAAPNSPAGTVAETAPTILVAAGGTVADFVVDGVESASGTVTFTATAPGFTDGTTTISVTPVALNFAVAPPANTTMLSTNSSVRAQVGALNAAGTGFGIAQTVRPAGTPIAVTFTSSDATIAQLVTSASSGNSVTATIAVGASETAAAVVNGGVELDPLAIGAATIAISGTGLMAVSSSSATVNVAAPTLTITQPGGTIVGAGLRQSSVTRVTLGAPAPAGGVTITLTSGAPLVALAAPASPVGTVATAAPTVTLTAGKTTADFVVDGVEGASGPATFTATASIADYVSASATFTVTSVAVNFGSILTSTTSGASNTVVLAQVGALNSAGTAMGAVQAIRPGGTALTLSFSNSNAAAAQLVTSGTTGQTVTATVAVGASMTAATVAGGGVAFDPLAAGTTTVAVTGAGLTPVPTSSKVVTVN